jgi:hypothetical protein
MIYATIEPCCDCGKPHAFEYFRAQVRDRVTGGWWVGIGDTRDIALQEAIDREAVANGEQI